MPEVIILPELWRKTSVVVPDCPHHVWMFSSPLMTDKITWICKKGGWHKGKKRK